MSRRSSLSCLGVMALLATSGGEALAVAPQPVAETYEDAAGVIRYEFDPAELPSASVVSQVGRRIMTGGCTFTEEGAGPRSRGGAIISVARELSFDPASCRRELAVADYPVAVAPEAVRRRAAAGDTVTASAARAGRSGRRVTARSSASYSGSLKVNVEDPPQIDVTTTKASVTWNAGGTVTSSTHNAHWGWYSPSGWQRTNAWWSYDRNSSRAYTNVYGKYKNPVFCFTIDTWTEHKKTWFEGRPYGGWYWSYSVDKWGGCTALLSYERIVVHP
jgi:hypothetical protein